MTRNIFNVLVACASVTVGSLLAGQSYAESSGCLPGDREVSLTGFLSLETYPGRPNYRSVEKGDEPETGYYLRLSSQICVEGVNYETEKKYPIDGIKKLQLVVVSSQLKAEIRKLHNRKSRVVVTGKPYVGITGHYHAPHGAAISVENIDAGWSQAERRKAVNIRTFDVVGITFSLVKVDVTDGCFVVEFQPSYYNRSSKELCGDYWIGETEITQKLYEAVMGNNPSSDRHKGPNNPVNKVSLWDAKAFLKKIYKRTGTAFRLPTHAEWVHACRAGGSVEPQTSLGWVSDNSGRETHPVATSDHNAIGIYDMLGNVSEWASPGTPLQPGYIYYWVLGYHYNASSGDAICSQAMQRYSFNRTPIIGLRLAMDD